jgi:hypothetical protein
MQKMQGAIFCHAQIFHKIRAQLIFLGLMMEIATFFFTDKPGL